MNQPSDKQIDAWTRAIAESDKDAFERLFRHLYPRLIHFTMRYVNNKATAGDIVQDAFVILWEKRRKADPGRSIKAYLYRIVRNRALNHIRDHSSRMIGFEAVEAPPAETDDPAEKLTDRDEAGLEKRMHAWIQALPDRQREAFELSRFEGLDHEEISSVMAISPNTVNNHIVAALQHLRECYEECRQSEK